MASGNSGNSYIYIFALAQSSNSQKMMRTFLAMVGKSTSGHGQNNKKRLKINTIFIFHAKIFLQAVLIILAYAEFFYEQC